MKRNFVVLLVVALAVAVMLLFARHRSNSASTGLQVIGTGPVSGKPAPDFRLVDIRTGQNVQLSDFRGKAVLLNFWATWCPPCKAEIPSFVDLQKQYGPQGLQVIGVAMDDAGQAAILKFANQMGVNYLVLQGTEKVAEAYGGVEGLPTTFYVGRDGKITGRVIGPVTHRDAEEAIKQALNSGMSKANFAQQPPARNAPEAAAQTAGLGSR